MTSHLPAAQPSQYRHQSFLEQVLQEVVSLETYNLCMMHRNIAPSTSSSISKMSFRLTAVYRKWPKFQHQHSTLNHACGKWPSNQDFPKAKKIYCTPCLFCTPKQVKICTPAKCLKANGTALSMAKSPVLTAAYGHHPCRPSATEA